MCVQRVPGSAGAALGRSDVADALSRTPVGRYTDAPEMDRALLGKCSEHSPCWPADTTARKACKCWETEPRIDQLQLGQRSAVSASASVSVSAAFSGQWSR